MPTTNLQNLRIGHLNVRGLERHIDGVKLLLDRNQYHFFAVTETKLKPSSPIGPIRIPAYNFIRHSLPSGRGRGTKTCGGIGLYVQKGIKATPIIRSTLDSEVPIGLRTEFLVIQAKINEINIGVVAFYNPLCSNPHFSRSYEKVLLDLLEIGLDRLFVVGDFNINIASTQPSSNLVALHRINTAFNLTILPTGPTRITENSSTTIDLLISDSPELVIKSRSTTGNTISDHEVIYLLADIRVPRSVSQTIRVRNIQAIDPLQLQADYQTKDLQPFFTSEDPTAKADLLGTGLRQLLDQHAPERNIVVRDKRTPWITDSIKRAVELRNMAYTLYARNPNRTRGDLQWQEYIRNRDRANTLIFAAKKRYAEMHFDHKLPAKKLWCNLRREGIHNTTKNSTTEGTNVEELNHFFTDGHRILQNVNQPEQRDEPPHRTAVDHGAANFNFRHTNVDEVCRKIYGIHTNATGVDEIPISFIKLLCPFILPVLTHLFNSIIETRSFPENWKRAIITPIPKTSNPIQPKDFRPISVLPAVSKVFEKVLLEQITDHIDNPNAPLLAKHQSGYRKGYSTTTALAKVMHDIYTNFDNNRCTVMVLVDFSLAFNCVKHRLLETKLRNEFHLSPAACELISSFLAQRKQSVRVGNTVSTERNVMDGTPQGSCLSALLFTLYINSLPLTLKCSYHLYADDLQVYISGPSSDVDRLVNSINEDLQAISGWAEKNFLSPNPKKTQAIIFSKAGNITPQINIVFQEEVIPVSNKVTNLGLQLDNNLSWSHQVNDVLQKTYNTLRTFRRFAPVLSIPTRLKLVQSVIMPIFTYCDAVYYPGLTADLKDRLHKCFKSVLRFVYSLRQRDSTETVRNTILGHDLPSYYKLRICCFMRRAYLGDVPEYITQHLQHGQQERNRVFIVPIHTTSTGKSLLVHGTSCWNSLPLEAKMKPTMTTFKTTIMRNL